MKNVKMLASASLLALAGSTAVAGDFYAGASYLDGTLELMDSLDADLPTVMIKGGYNHNEHIALELRGGWGVSRDKDISGSNVNIELDDFVGGYVVFKMPTNTKIEPYVLAGYTRAEFEAKSNWGSDSEVETDFSYGFGANYNVSENFAVNAEWVTLIDKGDLEFGGPSVGAVVSF